MAGIFANVDSDISKLRQLKAEIEKVKNALKSINVKVDIDIAQGLEAKLKSLTGQYDALVQRVSQAEGKVIASTQRINQASEKIVKAQEQLAKASGVQSNASSNGGAAAAANQAETASVQAQAKAYDELAAEIDAVMGTRADNIKRMLEEQNAIRLINAEIKNLTKYQGDSASMSSSQQRRLEQLNTSLLKHKTALSELRQSLNNSFKLDNSAATSMNALSQSLGRMRMAYRELTEEERNSPFGQELVASIQQADARIKQLDASIGNHQRNVGNYASGWNGLGMSIQQIGRELPSLAMGWNTFFLAISNNLPILTDEISRARKEYEMLKKSGQQATPVWKQVVSSLLSWQTALTVGITLLTLYGDEIIKWVKGVFSARKEMDILADEQQQLNKAMSEARSSAVKQQTDLRVLYSMTQNVNASMESRLSAIRKLQQQYPAYFGNLSQEAILAGKASSAYQQLTKDLMAVAYAQAYQKRMEDLAEKSLQERRGAGADKKYMDENKNAYQEYQKALDNLDKARDYYNKNMYTNKVTEARGKFSSAQAEVERTKRIAEEYDKRKERYDKHIENVKEYEKEINYYAGLIVKSQDKITKVENGRDDRKWQEKERKANEKRIKNAEDVAKQLLALRRKNQEDEIALMDEGREKKLAQIRLEYEEELAEIDRQEKEWAEKQGGETTVEQRVVLSQARDKAAEKRIASQKELFDSEIDALYEYLETYGSIEEQKLAITERYNKEIANETNEWRKKALREELNATIESMTADNLIKNMDLSAVFTGYGNILAEPLKDTVEMLEKYTKTDAFKSRSFEDQKTIFEALEKARKQLGGIKSMSMGEVGDSLYEYNNALVEFNTIAEQRAESAQAVIDAEKELNEAEKELAAATTESAKAAANDRVVRAKKNSDDANIQYNSVVQSYNDAQSNLVMTQTKATSSLNRFHDSIDKVGNVAQAVASGSMAQLWEALGSKTQSRIIEFVSGTRGMGNAISTLTERLSERGVTMDKFSEKIGAMAQAIFDSGEKVDASGITEKITAIFDELAGSSEGLDGLGSKIANSISEIISKAQEKGSGEDGTEVSKTVGKAATEIVRELTNSSSSLWGLIVGLILDILDILKEGIGNLVETILSSVGGAIEGILTEIGNGQFFVNIVEGIGSVVKGIAFGIANLFSGGALNRDNEEKMEKVIERLTEENEALRTSIESLRETIENADATNSESIEAYRMAVNAEKEWQANMRESINAMASEWTRTGYGVLGMGGKSSFNAHVSEDLSQWVWEEFNRALSEHGYSERVSNVQDMWNLSPEAMKVLRDFSPSAWAEFFSTEGHKNPQDLVNQYIDSAGNLDELTDKLNEKLTGYSWEAFRDSYKELLLDMEADTEDFADNINKVISEAVVSAFMTSDEVQNRIRRIYDMIVEAAGEDSEGGTDITQQEADSIRAENEALAELMLERREQLKELGLIMNEESTPAQQASSAVTVQASQESIDEGNGRLLAIQETGLQMLTQTTQQGLAITDIKGNIIAISASMLKMENIGENVRDILADSYLELVSIRENTGAIVKPIQQMQLDIEQVKQNTSRI